MPFHITRHAIDRYCERVEAVTRDVAKRRILAASNAIENAIRFGCGIVVLPCRARLIIEDRSIVTVRPPEPKRSAATGKNKAGRGHIGRSTKGRRKWRCSTEEMEQ